MNRAYLKKYGDRSTGPIAVLAILIAVYILLSMRPFFTWEVLLHPILSFAPVVLFIYLYSLLLFLNNALVISSSRLVIAILLFILMTYLSMPFFGHSLNLMTTIRFLPLLCLVFLPNIVLYRSFIYFHKLMVFFSVASILLFTALVVKIDLPHFIVPGFTLVTERTGDFYKIYGVVASSTNTVYNVSGLTFARVLGPFLEPGHFAIYLGLTLLTERYLFNTTNKYIVIAGLLTFSPAFIFTGGLILVYSLIIERKLKTLMAVFALSLASLVAISDENIRNEVYYLTIGRNFEDVATDEYLDNRTSSSGLAAYEQLKQTPEYWVGLGIKELEDTGILSDYRGFIFKFGILGMTLLTLLLQAILFQFDKKSIILYLPMVLLILAHRAWMFETPQIYALLLITGLIAKGNKTYKRYIANQRSII